MFKRSANTDPETPSAAEPAPGRFPLIRVLAVLIGLVLIAAAVWAILANRAQLDQALVALAGAEWYVLGLIVLLPGVNWICTSATVGVLTGRYARVPMREMLPLIGSAWLLNMLPMRLGMIGRVAYHKKYHGMRVRDCAKVMAQAIACSILALSLLVLVVLVASEMSSRAKQAGADDPGSWRVLAQWGLSPLLVLVVVCVAARARVERAGSFWRWPAAVLFRYLDMCLWFVRYWLVFAAIGHPITPVRAASVTVSAQAAMVTPVQFGLREWAVGLTAVGSEVEQAAPRDDGGRVRGVVRDATVGLVADACMRAAELCVIIPVGGLSTLWVMRSMRKGTKPQRSPQPAHSPRSS
ncbi:MAG: hypothetical protein AB7G11_07640 [Phycisphaerales bacterium]